MKFFIDTADIAEIKALAETGMVDGVTTNPTLIAKSGKPFLDTIKDICSIVHGPVSAEVTATDYPTIMKEAAKLRKLAHNVTIKVPLTPDGLRACRELTADGIMVNVTLCFSATQAILAAKAGATYVSPFVGRLDDIGADGNGLIHEICEIYSMYPDFETQVLAASIRRPQDVVEAARVGAHVATIPPKILLQMYQHPLTDRGLDAFLKDWAATGQSIL